MIRISVWVYSLQGFGVRLLLSGTRLLSLRFRSGVTPFRVSESIYSFQRSGRLIFGLRSGFTPFRGSAWLYSFCGVGVRFLRASYFGVSLWFTPFRAQAWVYFFWGVGVRLLLSGIGLSFIAASVWVYSFGGFGLDLLLFGASGPVYSFQELGLLILGFPPGCSFHGLGLLILRVSVWDCSF